MSADLLQELREAASLPRKHPIVIFGLPRWSALGLSRARAAEFGRKLERQHADSIRDKQDGNPHVVLWLPVEGHPNKGVHLLCHAGFEGGVVIGWADWRPLMWPRSYMEWPGPLLPWRADFPPGVESEAMANSMAQATENLAKIAIETTRRNHALMQPSPALMAIIAAHSPEPTEPVGEGLEPA